MGPHRKIAERKKDKKIREGRPDGNLHSEEFGTPSFLAHTVTEMIRHHAFTLSSLVFIIRNPAGSVKGFDENCENEKRQKNKRGGDPKLNSYITRNRKAATFTSLVFIIRNSAGSVKDFKKNGRKKRYGSTLPYHSGPVGRGGINAAAVKTASSIEQDYYMQFRGICQWF